MKLAHTIKLRRDSSHRWTAADPVLAPGEPGYETDTGRFKIGDGSKRWSDLIYFHPGDDAALYAVLEAHVKTLQEAVIEDDGPSFFLLYENAKV